ncbi:NAD-dependent epimerase/dehydratase [Thalassoporum mexicanum PCC 7367]|nr:NAD-dependent epimerase/dehydratase [Pseudanabaena sp. PCC 7367]
MGGTRFVGVALTQNLISLGHEVVLFNRGNRPAPAAGVKMIQGDRKDIQQLKEKLSGQSFDAIFDNSGRELSDTKPIVDMFRDRIRHFIYMSSAGVYQESETLPYFEEDPTNPESRHKGKLHTEAYLKKLYSAEGFPFTSIRPTYIYGPGNYNDVEAWFFDRIVRDRPVPIPGNGQFITQLGHVEDLAAAMAAVLKQPKTYGEIYNISDIRYVTYSGIAKLCAQAIGKDPDKLQFVYYNPKDFDFGKKKAFPFRLQHFFTAIDKALLDLDWEPEFDLVEGLETSFKQDYVPSGRHEQEIDFAIDDQIIAAAG